VVTNSGAPVTLSKLTLQNGLAPYGGGVDNYSVGTLTINSSIITKNHAKYNIDGGGGIYNGGTLTINDSTVSGNTAGGARFGNGGGGILNGGTLTINKSTINSNQAARGGGISNQGTLTINSSTISGNGASTFGCVSAYGGGIEALSGGGLTINNSTISGNSAHNSPKNMCSYPAYGGGIHSSTGRLTINNSTISGNSATSSGGDFGGGIDGMATLQNSIVANNTYGGNCYGTMTSNGYNLSSDNTCNFSSSGDLNNTDPKLGQLGNYGGPTQTLPLLFGSPAIDAGNPNGCTDGKGHLLKTDQRGKPRPDREDTGGCDMGAYERQKD